MEKVSRHDSIQKRSIKNKSIKKTLKFNNIKVHKKEFHKSKQAIDLDSVDTGKIVVSANLNIVKKVLNTLLVIKKMKLLNHYVLSYLK